MPKNQNNTTATAAASTTSTKKEPPNAQLARQISLILTNPNTPVSIYNALADEVSAIHTRPTHAEIDSAEYIEMVLDQHDRARESRQR